MMQARRMAMCLAIQTRLQRSAAECKVAARQPNATVLANGNPSLAHIATVRFTKN
jgi:hypothetical protein